jgi:hypothetical protein
MIITLEPYFERVLDGGPGDISAPGAVFLFPVILALLFPTLLPCLWFSGSHSFERCSVPVVWPSCSVLEDSLCSQASQSRAVEDDPALHCTILLRSLQY